MEGEGENQEITIPNIEELTVGIDGSEKPSIGESGGDTHEELQTPSVADITGEKKGKLEPWEDRRREILEAAIKITILSANPNSLKGSARTIVETYRDAQKSLGKIKSEPAEFAKLVETLKTLHRQANLGEYQLEVNLKEGESDQDKERKVREQLTKDMGSFVNRATNEYFLGEYDELRGRADDLRGRLAELVSSEDPSRTEVRILAHDLQRLEARIERHEDRLISGNVEGEGAKRALEKAREGRFAVRIELHTPYEELPEDEKKSLYEQKINAYKDELKDVKGEDAATAFESMTDEAKKGIVEKLIDVDQEIATRRKNMERSVNSNSPEWIMEQLDAIREKSRERKMIMTEMGLLVAEQRVKNAEKTRGEMLDEAAEDLSKLHVRDAVKKIREAFSETRAARKSRMREQIRARVEPMLNAMEQGKARVSDAVSGIKGWMGERTRFIGKAVEQIKARDKEIMEANKAKREKFYGNFEKKKIEARKGYYQMRHKIRTERDIAVRNTIMGVKYGEKIAGTMAGMVIASEKKRGELLDRTTELFERRADTLIRIRKRYQDAPNPDMKYFYEKLLVEMEGTEPEEDKREEVSAPPVTAPAPA